MERKFTDEEIRIAKSVDLTKVAESLGYTPKRIGRHYTLKEMDSIRIYDRRGWYRWSRQYDFGENGGSQIDFLRVFAGMSVREAISWLLDFAGYRRMEPGIADQTSPELKNQISHPDQTAAKDFVLPPLAKSNLCLYSYLQDERCLSRKVINYFVKSGLIYESSPCHNIVFRGNDADGTTRFASMRGTNDREGSVFKCDVAGNDKHYGFNVVHKESSELVVFEAAIDLMSYMDMYDDFETNMLALGMLSDAPLQTFLGENPHISKIRFCLDNDGPGRRAAEALTQKYRELGYGTEDCPPPAGYKDYNEWLVSTKRALEQEKGQPDREAAQRSGR